MDQDKMFEAYWKLSRDRLKRLTSEEFAREVWYGCLNAQTPEDETEGAVAVLNLLKLRGGPLEALADAGLLFTKKGDDYNTGFDRDQYFPLGLGSYAQMLWVKCLRLMSFAKQPRQNNFEGPRDTCLDLISYAAFSADWLRREEKEKRHG